MSFVKPYSLQNNTKCAGGSGILTVHGHKTGNFCVAENRKFLHGIDILIYLLDNCIIFGYSAKYENG